MPDSMIERVARALCRRVLEEESVKLVASGRTTAMEAGMAIASGTEREWRMFSDEARTAIKAMREPTFEVIDAGMTANRTTLENAMDGGGTMAAWRAMIDAALK